MSIKSADVVFSLGTWAAELGTTRDILRRVASEAGVAPVGKRSGHPVYRGRDIIGAWVGHLTGTQGQDPDALRPMERKAHYQAEHEKLRLQVERREVIPVLEVERSQGQIFAITGQLFDTIPDIMERDVGLTPLQLKRLERHLDEAREALYQALNEESEETDDDADSAAGD